MNTRDVYDRASVKTRARQTVMFWLLLSAMGCAPVTQDLEAEGIDELDAGADFDGLGNKALSATYEAERNTSKSGCTAANDRSGFMGTGFMDYGGSGTWIEWNNVSVDAAGTYSLTFRYANGGPSARQAGVSVNGASGVNVTFAPTGSWTTWKSAPVIRATLRKGTNTIRVTATTSNGGPNLDNMTIAGEGTGGGGSVGDLQFRFVELENREYTTFNNVTEQYIVFAESAGRNGHNDMTRQDPSFVGMSGATYVGHGGGRDKYVAVFKVTDRTVTIDKNQALHETGGEAQVLFVKTARTLRVTKAGSLDPEMVTEFNLPSPPKVPAANGGNEIVIYAEDEGGKGTGVGNRDLRFKEDRAPHAVFNQGHDDMFYVFANNKSGGPNGNGAFVTVKIE